MSKTASRTSLPPTSISRASFIGGMVLAAAAALPSLAFAKSGEGSHSGSGTHGTKPGGSSSGPNGSQADASSNATVVLADQDAVVGGTYTADQVDQSVFEASGDVEASIEGASIEKVAGSASSADASSFRGVNAAVRIYGDARVTISNCTISADAENATGVFAYENGCVEIADSTVEVTGGGAGGVQVAGGGTLIGRDLTVTSASKAAIRSDRGGGVLDLTGGTYTSTGSNGCPAIYSTADITVRDAVCTSTNSRAVIIEGKNSVTVENCELSGNDQSTKEGSVRANVLLYQSASGDASEGTSVFTMTGGQMACASGAMFYCTNTSSVVNLCEADLELSEDGSLLVVGAGRWGKEGANGGDCTFSASGQKLRGAMTVDLISKLALELTDGSTFEGSINAGGPAGAVTVAIDETSSWVLTADSHVDELLGSVENVDENGFTLTVGRG